MPSPVRNPVRISRGGPDGFPSENERVKPQNPELVAVVVKPDYALGPHTAFRRFICEGSLSRNLNAGQALTNRAIRQP